MPTVLSSRTTGTPEMPIACVRSMTSRIVMSGPTVIGLRTMPLSNFLTIETCWACCSIVMFLWMMPMPPSCAMAMASRDSVTVSMAADRIGMFSVMSAVRRVLRSTSRGSTSE